MWVTVVILVDCVTETPSLIQVNVSGGEPDEMQVSVILDSITISLVDSDDDDMALITGAAVRTG